MRRAKKPSLPKLKKQCDDWNKAHPIGTAVILKMDDGKEFPTKTRSDADVRCECVVIWLEGGAGFWPLNSVRPA